MSQDWTIRRVVDWMVRDLGKRGVESPRLDADLMVAHVLGMDRVGLYMDLDRPLLDEELGRIRQLVERRRRREPIAYILGRREFWGRSFEVGPAVLVPRPETETLVEVALSHLGGDDAAEVLDLCTGSGIIAITLAAERENLRVHATDVSGEAPAVARRNAEALGVSERVVFRRGDLFEALAGRRAFRLLVANPPYVSEEDFAGLASDVAQHEPRSALVAGEEGLAVIRRIVAEAPAWLEPGGRLVLEVGAGQASAVLALIEAGGALESVATHRDLAGVERVVEASLP